MLLALLASGFALQVVQDPTALPLCDASLPAAISCSLFGEPSSPPDVCETPSWRQRAHCAVSGGVALAAEVKSLGLDCGNATTTRDMETCVGEDLAWENARMETYLHAALIGAYEVAQEELAMAIEGGPPHPYGAQFIVDLHETQRLWENYAQRVCNGVGEQYSGGSIRPLMEMECAQEMTRERTRVIWAHSLGGGDGDVTWPEPKASVTDTEIQTMIAQHAADPSSGQTP